MKIQMALALAAAALLWQCVPVQAAAQATVDPAIRYETWEGWGTSLAWWAKVVGGYPQAARMGYMDKTFSLKNGLGLNIVRYNIGGGENPAHLAPNPQFLSFRAAMPGYEPSPGKWDWNADANQRWVLQQALKMGVNQVEAFSNSPPWWMTVSGSVTGNHGAADNLNPADDRVFADYLATVVKHFHDDWGVTFRDIEPLNEPSGTWWTYGNYQEGCHVDRPHQNLIVKAMGAALARQHITHTTVTASDESLIVDADKTFGYYDPTALSYLTKINTHSYGGGDRTQLFDFANSAGKDLWMSEDGDGDPTGLQMSRQILTDINGLHPSAWITWQVVDEAVGWGFFRNPQDAEIDPAYTINEKYYVMGQYSRFIRPGDQIIAVTDPSTLAAYDPHAHTLILVTTNSHAAAMPMTYDLAKFSHLGASASVTRTSATQNWTTRPAVPIAKGQLLVTLPAQSVTTFVVPDAVYDGPMGFNFRAYHSLVNVGSGQRLTDGAADAVQMSSTVSGNDWHGEWGLIGLGNGNYQVINRRSGLVLDVSQAAKTPGASVIQYDANGGDNQVWHLEHVRANRYRLINRNSGLALSVSGSGSGASVSQKAVDGTKEQQWSIRSSPS